MMSRFDEIEKKLNDKSKEDEERAATAHNALSPSRSAMPAGVGSLVRESTAKKDMVVSVQKIQRIEDTFG